MGLATPIALLLLMPWGWVAWRTLRRRGDRRGVPFLHLWPVAAGVAHERGRRLPPWPVVLALLAILLAVLAATGPWLAAGDVRPIALVDHGPSMPPTRRSAALARLDVDTVAIPDIAGTSSLPTAALLERAVAARDGRILVVSDQPTGAAVQRVPPAVANAGIRRFAVADGQIMVTIETDGPAGVRVVGDAMDVQRADVTGTVFFDLVGEPEILRAEVDLPGDGLPGDDVAWLVRQPGGARLTTTAGVPEVARRFAAVWNDQRPATPGTPTLTLGDDGAISFADDLAPAEGEVAVVAHPVTTDVDWRALLAGRPVERLGAMPTGFEPIVRQAGRPVVAVGAVGEGQVWIGFALEPATPAVVVVLANAVEWVAGAAPTWSAGSVADVEGGWTFVEGASLTADYVPRPGVWRDGSGRLHAANVGVMERGAATGRGEIADLVGTGRTAIGPILAVSAALLWAVSLAGLVSGRRRRGWRAVG